MSIFSFFLLISLIILPFPPTFENNRENLTDPSDPGGRLGPTSEDQQPDFRNLQLFLQPCDTDDIIILVSDGVHDNLDPSSLNILPWEVPEEVGGEGGGGGEGVGKNKTWLDIDPREGGTLKEMYLSHVLKHRIFASEDLETITPEIIADKLIEEVERVIEPSRKWMEENPGRRLPEDKSLYPGKMDHVTIVAFRVGSITFGGENSVDFRLGGGNGGVVYRRGGEEGGELGGKGGGGGGEKGGNSKGSDRGSKGRSSSPTNMALPSTRTRAGSAARPLKKERKLPKLGGGGEAWEREEKERKLKKRREREKERRVSKAGDELMASVKHTGSFDERGGEGGGGGGGGIPLRPLYSSLESVSIPGKPFGFGSTSCSNSTLLGGGAWDCVLESFLNGLQMSHYMELMVIEKIDFEILQNLSAVELRVIGIPMGDAKRIQMAVQLEGEK